jgi:hypothetical protein
MGYTATRAGEALAGGGLALLVVMPLAGIATGRLPARNMAAFGFACFACAFYYTSTHFTLTMTFGFASWLRILQMFAIPFAFFAITTAAYVGLPKEASNQVLRDHQLRPQRWRQHLHRCHWSDRHQPLSLPPGAPAGVHAGRQFRLRHPGQRAYLLLRRKRQRAGTRPHGTSFHLSAAQSASCGAGLSGHLGDSASTSGPKDQLPTISSIRSIKVSLLSCAAHTGST